VIVRPWNDVAAVEEVFAAQGEDIAAIITEPILCNSGAIAPRPGYLRALVDIAHAHGALVIFDEIITGFRVAPGGAGEYFGVTPDLATFGKAVAGGMQLSALAGRAEVMAAIARGDVAHAGTFNSHPVAVAAARATLGYLDRNRIEVYERLTSLGQRLMAAMTKAAEEVGEPLLVDGPGPVFQTYFTAQTEVHDYRDFARTDRAANLRMQALLADQGVNVNSRGLWFMSSAHTESDIDETADSFRAALQQLRQ
jgi:glutamate-1-semialdehyde 2,1-aminomutase